MPIIEMGDPDINVEALNRRIEAQVGMRQRHGDYPENVIHVGPDSLLPSRPGVNREPFALTAFPGLNEQLIDLAMHAGLQEPRFTSSVPLVGPAIVAIRRMWNWMSTKWYVLPLVGTQADLNTRYSLLFSALAQWQELNAQEVAELRARVAELERRLDARDEKEL